MDNNTVTILNEEFENDKTGEKVQGITIIVEGKLKEVLDLLMKNNPDYKNYTEIVRDAFFNGINSMIKFMLIIKGIMLLFQWGCTDLKMKFRKER